MDVFVIIVPIVKIYTFAFIALSSNLVYSHVIGSVGKFGVCRNEPFGFKTVWRLQKQALRQKQTLLWAPYFLFENTS